MTRLHALALALLAFVLLHRTGGVVATAQPAPRAPADRLIVVAPSSLHTEATDYAAARVQAYAGRLELVTVLSVERCIAQHPGVAPEESVRRAIMARIGDDAPKPDPDNPALPGDAGPRRARTFVLIVGDVPARGQTFDPAVHVPCFYREFELTGGNIPGVESERDQVASDNPYSARPGDDDVPLLAVGRLPVTSAGQLRAHLAAVSDYEQRPPPGTWRTRMTMFAGDPGFQQLGPQVRSLIEKAYETAVIRNLSTCFDVRLTYANPASPYTWPAPQFSQRIVDEINSGALFLNYLGHGWKDSVDTLRYNGRRYRVFTAADAARVDCRTGRPIAAFFTCFTGCYDNETPSLAEALLLNPNGPLGVIASSRVSNEINVLLEAAFAKLATKDRVPTLGELFVRLKRAMLASMLPIPPGLAAQVGIPTHRGYTDGKRAHLWLYNLFGDPTLRIAHVPDTSVGLHLPAGGRAQAGRWLQAQLLVAPEGATRLEARLEIARGSTLAPPLPLPEQVDDATLFAAMRENHARMHRREACATSVPVNGPANLRLNLPASLPEGEYHLRLTAFDPANRICGTASTRVYVAKGDGHGDY